MIKGGKLGYVTPAANPCKTRNAKTSHKLTFDATGITKVIRAQISCVLPSTVLVPIFSASVPPKICSTMYP